VGTRHPTGAEEISERQVVVPGRRHPDAPNGIRVSARELTAAVSCQGLAHGGAVPFGGILYLDMRLTPDTPALRRWRVWGIALIVAEICWFVLLRPRIDSYRTVLVLALLPLTVVGYVYLMVAVSAYLADQRWDFRLRQMIVVMLGLSVGCFVFSLLWLAKVHFTGEIG